MGNLNLAKKYFREEEAFISYLKELKGQEEESQKKKTDLPFDLDIEAKQLAEMLAVKAQDNIVGSFLLSLAGGSRLWAQTIKYYLDMIGADWDEWHRLGRDIEGHVEYDWDFRSRDQAHALGACFRNFDFDGSYDVERLQVSFGSPERFQNKRNIMFSRFIRFGQQHIKAEYREVQSALSSVSIISADRIADRSSELVENILAGIHAKPYSDQIQNLTKMIETGLGDIVLFHLEEFKIQDSDRSDLIYSIGSHDPELFFAHFDEFNLIGHAQAEELFMNLLDREPRLALAHLEQSGLDPNPVIDYLIHNHPKLFIHYLDEFLVTLIPEGKMAECVHAINKYFDRLYTGNPARAVNELYGLKINNPVINGLIEKYYLEALQIFVPDVYQELLKIQSAIEDEDKDIIFSKNQDFQPVIKYFKEKGLNRGYADILALAVAADDKLRTIKATYNGHEYDEDISFRYGASHFRDADNRIVPGHSSSEVVHRYLIDKFVREEDWHNAIHSWVAFFRDGMTANSNDLEFFEDLLFNVLRSAPEIIMNTAILEDLPKYRFPREKELLDIMVKLTDDWFFFQSGKNAEALRSRLSESQKLTLINKLIEQNPVYLAEKFKLIRLKNKKQEYEMLRRLIRDGIEPFSYFSSPGQALKILLASNVGRLWDGYQDPEHRREIISHLLSIKDTISPETWDFIQSIQKESHRSYDISQLSLDSFKAIDYVRQNKPEIFQKLQGPRADFRLKMFECFERLNTQNVNQLTRILSDIEELSDGIESKLRRKVESYSVVRNAAPAERERIIKDQIQAAIHNLKEPERSIYGTLRSAYSDEVYDYIALALATQRKLPDLITTINKVQEGLKDESSKRYISEDKLLDFCLRDNQITARYNLLRNNVSQLKAFNILFGDNLFESPFQGGRQELLYLDLLFDAPPDRQQAILGGAVDFDSLSRGLERVEVIKLTLQLLPYLEFEKGQSEVELFQGYIREFGLLNEPVIFSEYKKIKQGSAVSPAFASLGVKNLPAVAGESETEANRRISRMLNNIRHVMRQLRDDIILTGEINPDLLTNDLALAVFRSSTHFDESQWRRSYSFEKMIAEFYQETDQGLIAPLPREYRAEIFTVKKLADENEIPEFEFSEVSASQFERFIAVANETLRLIDFHGSGPAAFREIATRCQAGLREYLDSLSANLEQTKSNSSLPADKKEKIISSLESQFKAHQQLFLALDHPENIVQALADFEIQQQIKKENKYTSPFLRLASLVASYGQDPKVADLLQNISKEDDINSAALRQIGELVNNNLAQHALPALNLSNKQIAKIRQILGISTFSDELSRIQGYESGRFEEFGMLPTRGFLGELSGYYCDACWTSRTSIMKANPRMTAVAFVGNLENEAQRKIVGGSLLIETEAGGEKVMIIRGFNPKQNTLAGANAEDFFEQFSSSVARIAKDRGCTKVIAPVFNPGAMSNRQEVLSYMDKRYSKSKKVKLDEEISFNGYNLVTSCVVIRDLKS